MSKQPVWAEAQTAEQAILEALQNGTEDVGPEMARRVYAALTDLLPIYEDVYDQCCDMLEPHVQRQGKEGGDLPASVVESLKILLEERAEGGEPRPTRNRAQARSRIVTKAIARAAVHTPFSLENLTTCGVFSGTPANAIACELAEQVLELQDRLSRLTA